MKVKKLIAVNIVAIAAFWLQGCSAEKFSDNNHSLNGVDFFIATITFHDTLKSSIQINNKGTVTEFVNSLNRSEVDGPQKGMGWDEIKLEGHHAKVVVLFSNGEVFSDVNSGTFYKLDKELKKYWK